MPVWTRPRPSTSRPAALVPLLLAAGLLAASCSDPPDSNPSGNNTGEVNCDGDTLSVLLEDPSVAAGFGPLTVDFSAQVSLIEPVNYLWHFDFGDGSTRDGVNTRPQATTVFTDPGEYTVTLTVTDSTCGRDLPPLTTQVSVYPNVELEGEELLGRPGNVAIGDDLRVSMRVLNTSDNDLRVPLRVRFLLSPNAGVSADQLPLLQELGEIELEADGGTGITVGAGDRQAIDETFTVPNRVVTGSYYLIAAIDPSEHVGEGDRRNNILASDAPVFIENNLVDAADLTVSNVQVGPSLAFQRISSISLNADITNIGSNFATDVSFRVYLQVGSNTFDPETAIPVYDSVEPVPLITFEPPDNVFQLRAFQIVLTDPIILDPADPDTPVYAVVVVDPDNAIREGSIDDESGAAEMNNVAISAFPINLSNTPQNGVDIVVIDFDIQPRATFLDGSVQLTLEAANFGTEATRSFFCSIYLSTDQSLSTDTDVRLTNINVSNIEPSDAPMQIQRTAVVPGFLPIGQFYAFAYCDPSNVVPETFEDNNIVALDSPITITPDAVIDLAVTNVTVDPTTVADGGDLGLQLTIANMGTNGAGPSRLRVRLSTDATINNSDRLLLEVDTPPINPNDDITLDLSIPMLSCDIFTSSYRLGLVVDATNLIAEVNEANNTTLVTDPLTITGDRCECAEDDYEANDTPANCTPITAGQITDLSICGGANKDHYCVDLEQGDTLSVDVNLRHTGPNTNLDLRILTPEFQPIPTATSRTDGQLEAADLFLVQQPGRYIIEISGRANADVNEYTMDVAITEPGPGIDLAAVLFNVSKTNPALAETIMASFTLLNTRNDDAGPFDVKLVLSADTAVDLTDFDLGTLNVPGLMGAHTLMQTAPVTIPVEATQGAYYVCAQIDPPDAIDETDEANNVSCSPQLMVDTSCYDAFEENNTIATAVPLAPGSYENLTVCDNGRSDFYSFCINDGERFDITASFTHSMGDLDMRLRLDDGAGYMEVDNSTGITNSERVEMDYVNGDQCFILELYHNNVNNRDPDGANGYSLVFNVERADPTLRCDGLYEPNDVPDQASASGANLLDAISNGLVLDRCPATDVDYYYLDLSAGPMIEICAENDATNPQNFTFTFALFDPSARQVAANTGVRPCVRHQVNVSGRYFVRITSTNRDRRAIRYSVSVDGLFGTDLVGRDFTVEPSDIVPGQSLIALNFTLQNGRTQRAEGVTYGVYYNPTSPIIDPANDLELFRTNLGGIDGLAERRITNQVIAVPDDPAFIAGQGWIGVFLDPDNTVTEVDEGNNRLFRSVNILACDDDEFEGNVNRTTAADILLNTTYAELNICPGTRDWFCLGDLEAGDYRVVALFALEAPNDLDSDLNLRVVRGDTGAAIASDVAVGDNAEVQFTLPQDAPVCVEVSPFNFFGGGANMYDLRAFGPLDELGGVDLTPINAELSAELAHPGDSLRLDFDAANLNADPAAAIPFRVFFSEDATLDASDTLLDEGAVPMVDGFGRTPTTLNLDLPADDTLPEGPGSILIVLDPDGTIAESDEANNTVRLDLFVTRCVNTGFSGNMTLASAATLTLGVGYPNQTICPTDADWYCFNAPDDGNYRVSVDFTLDGADPAGTDLDLIVFRVNAQGDPIDVLARDSAVASSPVLDFALPDASRVCVEITASAEFGGNTYAIFPEGPITEVAPVDLRASGLSATPNSATPDVTSIDISFNLTNLGADDATAPTWTLFLSQDNALDMNDTALDTGSTADLGANATALVQRTLTLPATATPGPAFLLAAADTANAFDEPNEDNNLTSTPITVLGDVGEDIDLTPLNLSATPDTSGVILPGTTSLALAFDLANRGDDPATDVAWRFVYSADGALDASDLTLDEGVVPLIAANDSAPVGVNVPLPDDPAFVHGQGTLFVTTDPDGAIDETDEANNTASLTATFTVGDDAAALNLALDTTDLAPGFTSVHYSFNLDNLGNTTLSGLAWRLVHSPDASITAADTTLTSGIAPDHAPNAAALVIEGDLLIPANPAITTGPGFVGVILDPADALTELSESNNTDAIAVNVAATCSGPDCCTDDTDCEGPCTATATCTLGFCDVTDRDGMACALTCDAGTVNGTCDGLTCVTPDEGPTGTASCADALDNDCDGDHDGDDSDCATPDGLLAAGPQNAPVGLASPGADILVTPTLGALDVGNQDRNLYCTALHLERTWDLTDPQTLLNFGPDPTIDILGGPNPTTHVRSGVPFSSTDPTPGAAICDGYSLVLGPIAMPSDFNGAPYTHLVELTLGNPPATEPHLGSGQHLIASYFHSGTSGVYPPMIAIGDDADHGIQTMRFLVVINGQGRQLTVRLDLTDADGDASGACAFVQNVKLFSYPFININTSGHADFVSWDTNTGPANANVRFAGATMATFNSIFDPAPGVTHQATFTAGANADSGAGLGLEWRTHLPGDSTTGANGFLDLPPVSVLPTFNRANMAFIDFNGDIPNGEFHENELAHLSLSTDDGTSFAKLASILPRMGVNRPAHLGVNYSVFRRTSVVLPEHAKTFLDNRLRFTQTPNDDDDRVYLDAIAHYTHGLNSNDTTVTVGATPNGDATTAVTVRTQRPGPTQVQCYWQIPGGADAPTIASEPLLVTFQ